MNSRDSWEERNDSSWLRLRHEGSKKDGSAKDVLQVSGLWSDARPCFSRGQGAGAAGTTASHCVPVSSYKIILKPSACFLCASFLQRAKISQGTKVPEEKTTNTVSKFDNNGNRDRMKLTDFNFLMVLGKGSFGKVWYDLVTPPTLEGTSNKAGTFAVPMGRTS